MNKEDLLKFCRYYHGEKVNPFDGKDREKALLWLYERTWIQELLTAAKNDKPSAMLSEYIDDYIGVGLKDFAKFDDTPVTLKAMLFNRYAKSTYSMRDAVDGFKDFYQKYYK